MSSKHWMVLSARKSTLPLHKLNNIAIINSFGRASRSLPHVGRFLRAAASAHRDRVKGEPPAKLKSLGSPTTVLLYTHNVEKNNLRHARQSARATYATRAYDLLISMERFSVPHSESV